jgi:hypothetical protein
MSVLAAGCAAPTLPLPPPAVPVIAESARAGYYVLASTRGVQGGAFVIVLNLNPALSNDDRIDATIADDEGSWRLEMRASHGDAFEVKQQLGGEESPPVTVIVP